MGSSCSSGQAHKDKDSVSTRSEESPSYQATCKKPSQGSLGNHSGQHSGIILEASTVQQQHLRTNNGTKNATGDVASPSAIRVDRKPLAPKAMRDIATSSASCDSVSLSSPPGTSAESPKDWPQLPPQVQQLPESTQNLLLGRVAAAKTNSRTNKIIIYVCAADSQDCCCEKRALHVAVAPALRESCRRRGYELHVVDLHWRTGLEKQQDHEFPELCLGELARQGSAAYVVPVLFLSNSLGTPLLPATVESADFEAALKAAGSGDDGLLRARYALDEHAQPPCFRLRPISQAPGFKETSVEEKEAALREWQSEIERTLAVMVEVFPQELRDTYLTTVVEQEVHNTVCMSQELARRCIWVYRVFTQAGQSDAANGQSQAGEAELKRRLDSLHNDLKSQLSEKHILRVPVAWGGGVIDAAMPEHAQYLATVTQQLSNQLAAVIDGIIEDHDKVIVRSSHGVEATLLDELTEQARFSQRAAQCSIDREDMLQQIKTYLLDTRQSTLVLTGPHGSGRTTLLAKLAQCCHLWLPEAALLLRHVNVSAGSATVEQLLCSLANQASVLATGGQVWGTHSVEAYSELLPSLLAEGGKQRLQIVIIDGLDQVKDFGSQTLSWLPKAVPANVKVIVSIADDTDMFAQKADEIANGRILLKMPSLGKAEADAVLMASVMQYSHSVDASVQGCVRASVQDCTLPLYVKVLAWQTSWWSNSDREMKPLGDIGNQVQQMLEELEALLDADKVALALALSTAAKAGVTDSEMIDLLAHEPEFHSSYTAVPWAPACLFWARLQKHLAPFVRWSASDGASTVRWLDAALESAARRRYLGTEAQRRRACASLVAYFAGDWVTENQPTMIGRLISQPNKTEESYNRRKLDELPFATFQLTGSLRERYLLDHEWLYDKLCGSHVFQVLEDLSLESRAGSNADLRLLTEFLSGHAAALAHDGRQLYGQLHRFLAAAPQNITSCPLAARLSALCACPPVPSLAPLPPRVGAEAAGASAGYDAVVALPASGFVATVATEREEVCVWSVADCRKVRTLTGVTQPICLQPVDPHRAVVLCGRELLVLNLEEGRVEVKLKGVMNQKMAFFGLHDANHLVALSRNRMYVNLLDLRTGDCVTTFKVGEDRFLNSLLVSGDGRVLVCGDETQKPFPLLVWNLSSRKLLYDLRIPHHDFVTSLAAITHEGHFVCCVATEVDEPGANFIVVYDLQSGTLFKKWKPGVDTVSVAISSRDACVVSGLSDARILVWDLVTGNCRHTLRGHSAPVTFLRLDPDGGTLLSTDSQGRDRTLRLWDLNNGSLISVYTPPSAVPCCELVPGGRHVVLGSAPLTTLALLGGHEGGQAEVSAAFGSAERDAGSFDLAASR